MARGDIDYDKLRESLASLNSYRNMLSKTKGVTNHGLLADVMHRREKAAPEDRGLPRGPYVEPLAPRAPSAPSAPSIPVHESRAFIQQKGKNGMTTEYAPVLKRTPVLNGKYASHYMKAYEAWQKKMDDYEAGKGAAWDAYYKKYALYEKKLAAYKDRIAKRDSNKKNRESRHEAYAARVAANKARKEMHKNWNGINYAGFAPWSDKYGEFKRLTMAQHADIGDRYGSLKHPNKKTVTLWDGRKVKVIDSELGVPFGFAYTDADKGMPQQVHGYNGASDVAVDEITGKTSADYVEEAFGGRHKTHDWTGDAGHIVGIHYSAYYQLLKVDFRSGDTCVYFRVPSTVAAELLSLAEHGHTMMSQVDGTQRHAVGIRFWDLVRIRTTKHGSRYRFEYGSGGSMSSYQKKWAYIPAVDVTQGKGGQSKFDREALTKHMDEWTENYKKEHEGKDPPHSIRLAEFTRKLQELKEAVGEMSSGYNTWEDDVFIDDLMGNTDRVTRVRQSTLPVSDWEKNPEDVLDNYFDTNYNSDLAIKNIDKNKLRKAYSMYEDAEDPEKIVAMLRSAGAYIDEELPEGLDDLYG